MSPILLPLSAIDPTCLPRDRLRLEPEALAQLQRSILAEGLRQPVEVFELGNPQPPILYGLISGLRRFTAVQTLAEALPDRFSTIPAFVRDPASIPQALAAMVTENEIRAEITPWEKAALVLATVDDGHFDTPDAALEGLFPYLTRQNRTRLRAVVQVVQELEGLLTDGPSYSLRQLLRISTALKAGFGDVIETALREHHDRAAPAQWELLQNILAEADLSLQDPTPPRTPAPRRVSQPHPRGGLTIRREWLPNGWRLVFTGPEAKGMMIESVFAEIERMYGPPPKGRR